MLFSSQCQSLGMATYNNLVLSIEFNGFKNGFEKRPVNQIGNERSKIANLLYSKPGPSLPDSFSAKVRSNKIILTFQMVISTD